MAGLYDLCFILGTADISTATNKFYFRARKGFYTGAIATATGVTVVTTAADKSAPVTPVKELLRSGVLKTVEAIALGTNGTTTYRAKIHYGIAEDATVDAALLNLVIPTVTGVKSSGATIKKVTTPLRVTGRS